MIESGLEGASVDIDGRLHDVGSAIFLI